MRLSALKFHPPECHFDCSNGAVGTLTLGMGPHPGPALGGQRERLYPPLPFLVSPSLVALFLSSTSLPFLTVHHHTHHICHNLPCSLPPDTQAGSGRDSPIIREFSPSTPNGTRMQEFYIRSPQHYPLCTAQARPLPSSLCLTSILTLLPVTYPPPRHGPPLLGSYRLSPPPLLLADLTDPLPSSFHTKKPCEYTSSDDTAREPPPKQSW
jgi:hypothetical protein